MSEEVVSLARKDGRLVALVSVATKEQTESPERFELREQPVDAVHRLLRPPMTLAAEAWASLRGPAWDDPRVLSSALTVMIQTVPLGCGGDGPRRHAAQAELCAPDAWRRLRDAMRGREARVLRLLRRAGHGAAVATLAHARDPYVAYHHRVPDEPGLAALPARFVAFVLPLLHAHPWGVVRRALAVYWGLGLHRDDAALALAVRLLARGREHGLAWLELMAREDPARRDALGRALLQTGALSCDPGALPARSLDVLTAEADETHADRLTLLLQGLRQGADLEHLLEGIRIARTFSPEHRFMNRRRPRSTAAAVPVRLVEDLRRVLDRFHDSFGPEWNSTLPVGLWDWSASTRARAALVRRPSLFAWPVHTTLHLLWALYRGTGDWTEGECLAIAERMLERVPASHHPNAIEELLHVCRGGRLEPRQVEAVVDLIVRLARPPFRASCVTNELAVLLIAATRARADRLARLPDRSLARVNRALNVEDADLVRQGLVSLGEVCSAFLFDALAAHPDRLISVARRLGILSAPRRLALLRRFRAHVVLQRRFVRWPLDRLCRTIEALVRRGLPNPVPRRLREHREGVRQLSDASVERHRQAIARRLLPFRLALLVRMTLEDLDRGVKTDLTSEPERHALEMLGSAASNRRLLRRVLRVPPVEREPFLERHPANLAWLARHPRVDAARWQAGAVHIWDLPDGRRLRLAIERDPMEVLRMGTRVGSCLSVGGCHSYSVVSVMADVNKRVVVARDAGGVFVARQLVAIAEDDRMVCFPVYPAHSGFEVEEAFVRYDEALALSLGLEIHRRPADDYEIGRVVAREFYDDGAWHRFTIGA